MINFFYSALIREIDAIADLDLDPVIEVQRDELIRDASALLDRATNLDPSLMADSDVYDGWRGIRQRTAQLIADSRTVDEVRNARWNDLASQNAPMANRIISCVFDISYSTISDGHIWIRTADVEDARKSVCDPDPGELHAFPAIDLHTYLTLVRNRVLVGDPKNVCFCGYIVDWIRGIGEDLQPIMAWDGILGEKRPTEPSKPSRDLDAWSDHHNALIISTGEVS